ncbi:hypothetical protein [Variovorax sp. LjRoot178]|uniref:hypothetical protein n=1 Tax=Variovorax sp. LjRoot178 TaxID=3342277 RepID=UPI003ECE8DD5
MRKAGAARPRRGMSATARTWSSPAPACSRWTPSLQSMQCRQTSASPDACQLTKPCPHGYLPTNEPAAMHLTDPTAAAAEATPPHTTPPIATTTQEQRSEVHRKLGRCLYRLQQYERLMKAVLVEHDLSGTVHDWQSRRQARVEFFAPMTLGTLVKHLKRSYLSTHLPGQEIADEGSAPEVTDQIWFSVRARMRLEPDAFAQTVSGLEELVALRNELVHHLMERFDLWNPGGCADADAYLERSYEQVDRHLLELLEWARHSDKARELMASALASDAIQEHIAQTVPSPPLVLNADSNIVQCLREAQAFLAVDGWTLLEDAIDFIRITSEEESPSRYNCLNWRQVLRDSGVFEYERQALPDREGLRVAYRTTRTRRG